MTTAWVVMTAMPPTKGHLHLIEFAHELADRVTVLLCTQPGEPYATERAHALQEATARMPGVTVRHLHRTVPQEPEDAEDFWELWMGILSEHGLARGGELIVASEPYGQVIADLSGNAFVPYDLARDIYPVRASQVRADPIGNFRHILTEFQPVLRRRITVFGAESTGKTTLSRALAAELGAHWLPEWARPFLEQAASPNVDVTAMTTIWKAQRAFQRQGERMPDSPFLIHDTDLVSTLGFWRYWQPHTVPAQLEIDARAGASDLYLITRSTIPFEADQLRYGIDERETTDDYWISLAEELRLDYRVLESSDRDERLDEAATAAREHFAASCDLGYERSGRH